MRQAHRGWPYTPVDFCTPVHFQTLYRSIDIAYEPGAKHFGLCRHQQSGLYDR